MTTASVAVSRDPGDPFTIEPVELGELRSDEILVKITAVGICHSDINAHRGLLGALRPIVLGHEGAGVVTEVGSNVHDVGVGDKVVLAMSGCGTCTQCLSGAPAYCANFYQLNVLGCRLDGSRAYAEPDMHSHFGRQSSFGTHAIAAAASATVVPPDSDLAVFAPLGCGLLTGAGAVFNSLQVRPASTVAVFGVGAVGLAAVMAAKVSGARTVVAVDRHANRLEMATRVGATDTVLADGESNTVEAVQALTGGGADYTIEASGHPDGLRAAVDSIGHRGVCGIVGTAGLGVDATFDWAMLQVKGATIRGVCLGDVSHRITIPKLVGLYRDGRFPFDEFVEVYPFEDINRAVADADSGKVIKPVLTMPS